MLNFINLYIANEEFTLGEERTRQSLDKFEQTATTNNTIFERRSSIKQSPNQMLNFVLHHNRTIATGNRLLL